jgi:hypothetical protein
MIVTSHAYSGLTTLIQQTLTQFSGNGTTLKQWVRMYDGTNYTAWTSTAHLSDNEVTFAKMQDIAGLSVIGKTGSGSGDPAEITAATSGHVLRYDGTNVAFGTLASGAFAATTDVPLTALADQVALSVVANATNASAAPTALAATASSGHVLRENGSALSFGAIANANIDANAAIALSKLATQGATTFVGNNAAGVAVPTSLSMATARTMLGLGSMYDQTAIDYARVDGTNQIGTLCFVEVSHAAGSVTRQTIASLFTSSGPSNYYLRPASGTWTVLISWSMGTGDQRLFTGITNAATQIRIATGGAPTSGSGWVIAIRTA